MPILRNKNTPPKILIPLAGKNARHCVSIRPKYQRNDSIFPTIIYFLIVMLILICFYIYAARTMRLHGILVNLPTADGITEEFVSGTPMLITITRDGSLYFNEDKQDGVEKIERKLAELIARQNNQSQNPVPGDNVILLRYDHDAPSALIFEIFSIARKHQQQVFVITDPPQQQPKTDFGDGKQ